jgi:glycosyltransferase involved in cell wall biosynthesis
MRVALVDSQVAFLHGGAEMLEVQLAAAIRELGHDVAVLRLPFNPVSAAEIRRAMEHARTEDLGRYMATPDVVVALRFPAYLVRHPEKRALVQHQLRQYYEHFEITCRAGDRAGHEALRADIVRLDREALGESRRVWSTSRRVAERLRDSTGLASALLHPPLPTEAPFYEGGQEMYVFAPSRLEEHKRQWLLIEAMARVRGDVKAVIGGEGGRDAAYRKRVAELGLGERVLFTGHVDRAVQAAWYANALAVFFGPHDEDYGFVTLEAMLSGKPVITCEDSGGTLEFVEDGANGFVVPADPAAIADRIDALAGDRARARAMGRAGRERYRALGLTWRAMAATLIGPTAA